MTTCVLPTWISDDYLEPTCGQRQCCGFEIFRLFDNGEPPVSSGNFATAVALLGIGMFDGVLWAGTRIFFVGHKNLFSARNSAKCGPRRSTPKRVDVYLDANANPQGLLP